MATPRRRKARRSKARRSSGRSTRRSRRSARRSSARSSSRSSTSTRKRRKKSARRRTYGPIRFSEQPSWVRRRGRKSLNRGRSAYRTKRRRSKARRSSRSRSYSDALNLPRSYRKGRKAAGQRVTVQSVMKMLRRTKLKAWVCAGRVRSGCGGGRKRYGGSRQIGVLR